MNKEFTTISTNTKIRTPPIRRRDLDRQFTTRSMKPVRDNRLGPDIHERPTIHRMAQPFQQGSQFRLTTPGTDSLQQF
jgi:hypothetical protein